MNNKEFIAEIASRMGYSIQDATAVMTGFLAEVSSHLEEEDVISIQGFGTFEVKKKLERVVVSPTTKQRMLVPPKMVLNFKASATFKEKIKEIRG